ncbi:MAG: hypothetical protein NT045_08315 [Candidatus Aureabacteria bacterium]|nr:hypothetical protein [Candidatus Auribacterota bacterium]
MATHTAQELCSGCLLRESCGYTPSPGVRLLRCLDRQTDQADGDARGAAEMPGEPGSN